LSITCDPKTPPYTLIQVSNGGAQIICLEN
jgi:hypothetical protein